MVCKSFHVLGFLGGFKCHGYPSPVSQDEMSFNLGAGLENFKHPNAVDYAAGPANADNNPFQ